MRPIVSLFVFLFISLSCFSQKEIIPRVTALITAGQFNAADHYLDSILKKKPRSTEALMMKGNVILNRAFDTLPDDMTVTADMEAVTSTKEINRSEARVVPVNTAQQIAKYWNKCLAIDSTQTDIIKGLCSVYGMALMKEELKKEILRLLRIEKADEGQAYRIADYARKFKERGRFNDAMEMYQFIADQYPALAGIRCDMAWEYFYEGRMNDALRYLDSALSKKDIDESSYLNAAFAYSELGYFDNAYAVFSRYSIVYNTKMDVFYKGLLLFSDADPKYAEVLNGFCNTVDSNAYHDEYLVAKELLSYTDTFSMEGFWHYMNAGHREWYLPAVYKRAMNQFPTYCEPFVEYGIFNNNIKNYAASVQLLEEGERCEIWSDSMYANWMLHYAYALYITGAKEKALPYWQKLVNAREPFNRQAAEYLIAKMLAEQNKMVEAKKRMNEVAAASVKTKYGVLSQYWLEKWK